MTAVAEKPSLDEMYEKHKELIHYTTHRFSFRVSVPYEDLFQVGFEGFAKACARFDESYGVKFSTYAVPMIEGEMRRYVRDKADTIRFSRTSREVARHLIKNGLEEEAPAIIEKKTGISQKNIDDARHYIANKQVTSLNELVSDNDQKNQERMELIGKEQDMTEIFVNDFLDTLTERERVLTEMLMNGATQQEVGDVIGVSQMQVSRIRGKVSRKLHLFQQKEGVSQWNTKASAIQK
ncbi:RNA polymerase sporulation-specific sigma factor [Alteribacillus persepolensis]|uniref:RNA polymerase sporulation-specific sigma factor n=1 Tax=Alteribacillus persepolensis TaxID=568899 RepID=A0A1G8I864_9BACI|nr:sigma-70 family RNA polymerase sigma factor [Alteribacillus persepolensis]SDI15054.1 RNA polymerase sporulation-specific sigma factor [Alteribacillus persepolensis]